MAVSVRTRGNDRTQSPLPLYNGDRLTQQEFHRRYETYPDKIKIELIGGIVYFASPQAVPHRRLPLKLGALLCLYEANTPGVEASADATVVLGDNNVVLPSLCLRVVEKCGGQSRIDSKERIIGAPELMLEVAHGTPALDLHRKKENYFKAGVQEYTVVCLEERAVFSFDFARKTQLIADDDGIMRSRAFPGLRIDVAALLRDKSRRLIEAINEGLTTPEHARFVKELALQRRRKR